MFARFLQSWVLWVTKHATFTLLSLLVATAVLGWVAVAKFHMNSDLSTLINQTAPWRADFDLFEDNFPELVGTAVVVVQSDSVYELEQTTQTVLSYLRARPEFFRAISAPGSEAFFRDHAFLYMSLDELDDTADRLAQAQPWLTAVAQDPSLRGIVGLLSDGLENDPPAGFADVVQLIASSAGQMLEGKDASIAWTDELFQVEGPLYQLIYLKANSSFSDTLPDAQVMAELRKMVSLLNLPTTTSVHITGELALQHEEIEAAIEGVTLAGWLALLLLLVVLAFGVRSGKIMLATFVMLAVGVVWTSAYAMLSVGEYNTLSVVFIVMFFGLGVDFALHFSLRYQEAINTGATATTQALLDSTRSVGRAISLCTLTTALGFLGFWPTDYQGLADLGIISAGGMAIAWFLTFTFLPAFYSLVGPPRVHQIDFPTSEKFVGWLVQHRRTVIASTAVLGVLAVFGASQASFDYSVLALKDVNAESMRTLRLLQSEGLSTDYQLVALTSQPLDPSVLEALDVVDNVLVPADLLPSDIEEKLYVIGDVQALLWSALEPLTVNRPPSVIETRQQLLGLAKLIDNLLAADSMSGVVDRQSLADFHGRLIRMSEASEQTLLAWQHAVVHNLNEELSWLRRATNATEISFVSLPQSITSRLISPAGLHLNVIVPAQDIAPVDALTRFIDDVREVESHATGRPVIEWGVGRIVIDAFGEAMIFAIGSIALVLLIAMRKLNSVLLILVPLLLAALFTLAFGVIFAKPINMANIIVLPLIFGLGVDNGIHVVDRYLSEWKEGGNVDHLMHSSTPRAVLMSTLTTIGAFAALSLSPHAGTASIGWLLTVAVGLLLLFTVFLLPVLLSSNSRST